MTQQDQKGETTPKGENPSPEKVAEASKESAKGKKFQRKGTEVRK